MLGRLAFALPLEAAMPRILAALFPLLLLIAATAAPARAADANPGSEGWSIYGDLKYKPGFTHFDYADPAAPKGGELREAATGTFDSLNPFILKGVPASGIGLVFDTLTVQSQDEPSSEYGLVAQTIEVPPDRASVTFTLRPEARFQDGSPITADDVVWTFDTLKSKGSPLYAAYYQSIVKAEALGPHKVKFSFAPGDNRELPLIIGQLPILSKKYYASHDFEKTTLDQPLGSGPYKVAAVDPGRSISYERDKSYWAKDLPVNKGRYNFDRIRIDYYRDDNVSLEAFKAGNYDFRLENSSKFWATGYASPALKAGLIKKEAIPSKDPFGMQGYAFNIRRDIFKDPRVRLAIANALDVEWEIKALLYGAYKHIQSYFANSELASHGLPSPEELKLLEPLKSEIPPEVLTEEYHPPMTDGSGNIRPNLAKALKLLEAAGWTIKGGRMTNAKGEQLAFEILLDQPAFERLTQPFVENLKRLGIAARIRTVDTAQYQNRVRDFDYDMIVARYGESISPGNEQRDYWSSEAADTPGSSNYVGIKDKAIDKLIDLVIAAPDRQSLVTRVHALDRVLLWHHYIVPQWYFDGTWVAYWDKFGRPAVLPPYGGGFDLYAWWIDPAKVAALQKKSGN
ncbi:MAG TPA: extracellular solute-binding protein [Alphaproteobacteria bacterium]|nr:extracellular solute-binding protein [Alphaproteobacteria bacterium]